MFYRAFEGMNPTLDLKSEYTFNSCFESGNLDCVIKVDQKQFDLFLRIDSNTRGHTQWFFFSVNNLNETGRVLFNLCNLTNPRTLYEQGMRPYVFSKKKYQRSKRGWEQDGTNVELIEKSLRYSLVYETVSMPALYKLSFEYEFEQSMDQVFFAYSIPYTYSEMLKDLQELSPQFVAKQILGRSLAGLDIPILHITNFHPAHHSPNKKNILITGRIHPGESNGSHVLNGFIQFLVGDSQLAVSLRQNANFFIVPMINPDGVVLGNTRSSASGKDLNRQYLSTKEELYPEVVLIKQLASKLQKGDGLMMFFDFHGHSRKKNTFLYGPAYKVSDMEYYKSRALARLIEKVHPNFRYHSCSFTISEQKKRTARAVLFEHCKIPYVFTIQSSIGLYYDSQTLKTQSFTETEWKKVGASIGEGLSEFVTANDEYEQMIIQRRIQRQKKRERSKKGQSLSQPKTQTQTQSQYQPQPRLQKRFFDEPIIEEDTQKSTTQRVMVELFEQVNQSNSLIPEPEVSSDDHNEQENLEASKLAQFNHLIVHAKKKNMVINLRQSNAEEPCTGRIIVKSKRFIGKSGKQSIRKIEQEHKKSQSKPQLNSNEPKSPPKSRIFINAKNQNTIIQQSVNAPSSRKEKCRSYGEQSHASAYRYLVSKQFFLVDKCEILDLPKSTLVNRRSIKKGRVMIEDYLTEKRQSNYFHRSHNPRRFLSSQPFRETPTPTKEQGSSPIRGRLSQRKTSQGRRVRMSDSAQFLGLQGLELDNMAMMIKTFNK